MFTNEVGKIKHRKMGSFLHNRGEVGNFIENTFFFLQVLRNKLFSNLTQTAVPQKFN